MPGDIDVTDNPAEARYELRVEGSIVGLAVYVETPGRRDIVHTEVDPALGGRGLGTQMVKAALDDIRDKGMRVTPSCPFVGAFIREHPDYADLL